MKSEELAKVLQAYREWVECTGFVQEGTSYFYEIESLLEDAYYAGLEAAAKAVRESYAMDIRACEQRQLHVEAIRALKKDTEQ